MTDEKQSESGWIGRAPGRPVHLAGPPGNEGEKTGRALADEARARQGRRAADVRAELGVYGGAVVG